MGIRGTKGVCVRVQLAAMLLAANMGARGLSRTADKLPGTGTAPAGGTQLTR